MWIRFSKNTRDITTEMEAAPGELKEIAEGTERVQRLMTDALEMAFKVWDEHPEFKQVTFDTFSKEELDMMEAAEDGKGGTA